MHPNVISPEIKISQWRLLWISTKTSLDICFCVIMEGDDFKTALEGALQFFPGIKLEREQELCLESLLVKRKDVLGVLPTGYGKSLIYQLLPKVLSQYWFNKNGTAPIKDARRRRITDENLFQRENRLHLKSS